MTLPISSSRKKEDTLSYCGNSKYADLKKVVYFPEKMSCNDETPICPPNSLYISETCSGEDGLVIAYCCAY